MAMGFAFPFRVVAGRIQRAEGDEKLKQNIRHLLSTRLNERLMLRSYGGAVHQRVQATNDSTLRSLVRHEVEQTLRLFMPQVRLTAPLHVESEGSQLNITIEYVGVDERLRDRVQVNLS